MQFRRFSLHHAGTHQPVPVMELKQLTNMAPLKEVGLHLKEFFHAIRGVDTVMIQYHNSESKKINNAQIF